MDSFFQVSSFILQSTIYKNYHIMRNLLNGEATGLGCQQRLCRIDKRNRAYLVKSI